MDQQQYLAVPLIDVMIALAGEIERVRPEGIERSPIRVTHFDRCQPRAEFLQSQSVPLYRDRSDRKTKHRPAVRCQRPATRRDRGCQPQPRKLHRANEFFTRLAAW